MPDSSSPFLSSNADAERGPTRRKEQSLMQPRSVSPGSNVCPPGVKRSWMPHRAGTHGVSGLCLLNATGTSLSRPETVKFALSASCVAVWPASPGSAACASACTTYYTFHSGVASPFFGPGTRVAQSTTPCASPGKHSRHHLITLLRQRWLPGPKNAPGVRIRRMGNPRPSTACLRSRTRWTHPASDI